MFNPDDLFLYAVTDSGMNKKWGRSIKDAVKAAIEGGATIVQLRSLFFETIKGLLVIQYFYSICQCAFHFQCSGKRMLKHENL
jgi:hydroxymethylpyrimidine kinase / phosphomethylpyrimidine kinase / thiamine-phosphate diphosphorylase